MRFVASLVVDRVVGDSKVEPLWPEGVNRLVLVVASADDGSGTLIAHGIDPALSCVMFQTHALRVDQLGAFVKAMIDGDAAVLADDTITVALAASNDNVVVTPNVPPKHVGPKLVAALAEATAANLDLAMPDVLADIDGGDDGDGGSAMAFSAAPLPA
jgi:hypothetical protein